MHILHLTLGFYPAVSWGGPVTVVHQNCKELVRRGHSVTIYCSNLLDKRAKIRPGTFEQEIDGIRVVYLDTINFSWWPGTLGPAWAPGLAAQLRREIHDFDVMHINGYRNPLFLPAVQAARKHSLPFVVQPHGAMPIVVSSFLIKRVYDKLLLNQELKGLSALIALQEGEKQLASNLGIPLDRIVVIPNGMATNGCESLPQAGSFRNAYKIPHEKQLILFLGRINKIKGVDMLVQAFAMLETRDAVLAIVGPDDGQLEQVLKLIQDYSLEGRVWLTGILKGDDVVAAYQDADLFVLPSRGDSFPTTVMEACKAGVPMVVSDRCEIASLVKDRIGDVTPFDAKAFSQAMQNLLVDHERYQRYQQNCPAVMSDTFSIEATVDRLEELYQRISSDTSSG